jgi:hypothetical protein
MGVLATARRPLFKAAGELSSLDSRLKWVVIQLKAGNFNSSR